MLHEPVAAQQLGQPRAIERPARAGAAAGAGDAARELAVACCSRSASRSAGIGVGQQQVAGGRRLSGLQVRVVGGERVAQRARRGRRARRRRRRARPRARRVPRREHARRATRKASRRGRPALSQPAASLPMRRTSSASRELKASPSSACQGNSAAGMACSSSRPPTSVRAVAAGSAPPSASATAWAMSESERSWASRGAARSSWAYAASTSSSARAASEPSARAEIAAVSHAQPVYAGPRPASGKVGYCTACIPPTRSPPKTSPSSATASRRRSTTSGRAATSPATGSASSSPSRWTPCGCSNLICGTNTLFYDDLRDTRGTGNFFRYADTYLFGVGCEPGDFNQLDVWPLHKFVVDPAADRRGGARDHQRPPHHAAGDARDGRPLPRRGRALDLERVPRAGALRRHVLAAHAAGARRATSRCVGNQRRRELRRAGDLLDARHRRRRAGAPAPAAPQPSTASRCSCVEEYRTLPNAGRGRARCSASPRCCRPATRSSRAAPTPTIITAGRGAAAAVRRRRRCAARRRDGAARRRRAGVAAQPAAAPTCDCAAAHGTLRHTRVRRDPARAWAATSPSGRAGTGSPTSATRSPSTTRCARRSASGTSRRCRSGCSAAPTRWQAADYCFTNDMAALEVGQARYGAFCDEHGKMLGDGVVYNTASNDDEVLVVTALPTDADHFRARSPQGARRPDRSSAPTSCRTCSCRARARASCSPSLTDADVAGPALLPLPPEAVTVGGVDGCLISRTGYSGELGYEIYCPPEGAERLWQALLDQGAVTRHPPLRPGGGRVAAHRVRA